MTETNNKTGQRADRTDLHPVERANMEPGNVYAEMSQQGVGEFDPVMHIDYSTDECPLCGDEGEYDDSGFVHCLNCGWVSDEPMLMPELGEDTSIKSNGDFSDPVDTHVGAY